MTVGEVIRFNDTTSARHRLVRHVWFCGCYNHEFIYYSLRDGSFALISSLFLLCDGTVVCMSPSTCSPVVACGDGQSRSARARP